MLSLLTADLSCWTPRGLYLCALTYLFIDGPRYIDTRRDVYCYLRTHSCLRAAPLGAPWAEPTALGQPARRSLWQTPYCQRFRAMWLLPALAAKMEAKGENRGFQRSGRRAPHAQPRPHPQAPGPAEAPPPPPTEGGPAPRRSRAGGRADSDLVGRAASCRPLWEAPPPGRPAPTLA